MENQPQISLSQKQLWINQRKLDQQGLIIPYPRERQFNLSQCVSSLQNLLAHQQSQSLPLHYFSLLHHHHQFSLQTITYRGYLVEKCSFNIKPLEISKNERPGEIYIQYRLNRLDKNQIKCLHPYFLIFGVRMNLFSCKQCLKEHCPRIFKSSFQAIRVQFLTQIANKLKFMNRFPNYKFSPHSFVSTRYHGETPFLRLKYEDYEQSEYFQKAEEIVINQLRLHCLRHNLDFEPIRFDEYIQKFNLNEGQIKKYEQKFKSYQFKPKTKYMCRNCPQKYIWTTKNFINIRYQVIPLTKNQPPPILDQQVELKKVLEDSLEKKIKRQSQIDRFYFNDNYKIDAERVDKSLIQEVEEYKHYYELLKQIRGWHKKISMYKYPYLVVISVNIPQINCIGCKVPKDGLIYVRNLVDKCNKIITSSIIQYVLSVAEKGLI